MTFTERLNNRHNWLEALGLCLLFHVGMGIILTGMIYSDSRVAHRSEPVISIIPITETIAGLPEDTTFANLSKNADTAIASFASRHIHVSQLASNKVKQPISAKTSLDVAKNTVKQAQSIADYSMEHQQQPEFPSVLSTEKGKAEDASQKDFKGDSQIETASPDITSTAQAGDAALTAAVEANNANGSAIEFDRKQNQFQGDELADYKKYLKNTIESVKQYPRIAKRRGYEGKVSVFFELDGLGRLLTSRIERSSGNAVLDEAALQAIQNAAPFSRPPTVNQTLTFVVVLDFRLLNK